MFSKYSQARAALIERLGEYCSYCEMQLDASLAVEHVRPKSVNAALELSWENFLLACTNCNSTKGSKDVDLDDYFWPEVDNTFLALDYLEGGYVIPARALEAEPGLFARAKRTIKLTGLDKVPGNDPAAKDRRWINRYQAWGRAKVALRRLRQNDTPQLREQIVDTALDKGFWSVWLTVFEEEPELRRRLIEAFTGTDQECFDAQGSPLPRGAL